MILATTGRPTVRLISLLGDNSQDTAEPSPTERARSDQPPWAERHVGEEDDFSFAGLLRILWTNKWGVLFSTAFFAGIAAWFVYSETPLYTATTLVVLETNEEKVVNFESVVPQISSDDTTMNTEIQVLLSRDLLSRRQLQQHVPPAV